MVLSLTSFLRFPYLTHGIFPRVPKRRLIKGFRNFFLDKQILDPKDCLVRGEQVHKKQVAIISAPPPKKETAIPQTDALITNQPRIALAINTADCLPIFLLDRERKVIALVHAGWRGLKRKIINQTIQKMKNRFSSSSKNIIAAIGPSIGPCCYYACDKEQLEIFKKYFSSYLTKREGQWYLNLWQVTEDELVKNGIKKQNIENSHLCTACHSFLSSHRREGEKRQTTNISFIIIKSL